MQQAGVAHRVSRRSLLEIFAVTGKSVPSKDRAGTCNPARAMTGTAPDSLPVCLTEGRKAAKPKCLRQFALKFPLRFLREQNT
jgi:hypothetical protein